MEVPAPKPYLAHLTRGSEHLRAEKLEDARDELEKASALKPGDGRIMNLLGLTYFRLARYPEAQAIYSELVRKQPQDAGLRLNLGLVHLKRGDVDEAIRELTRARELDPSQVRTMGYLGLAFARKGRYALARDAFYAAGQDELAKEMDTQLTTELSQVGRLPTMPPHNGASIYAAPPPPLAPTPMFTPAPPEPQSMSTPTPTPMPAATSPAPEPAPRSSPALADSSPRPAILDLQPPTPIEALPAEPGAAPERLETFTRRRLLRPEARDLPLELSGDALIVRVRGRILTRTSAIVATGGQVAYAPATRRVRGRVTPDPFAGEGAMSFASGDGHLVVLAHGGIFAILQLVEQSLYLREPLVFAFEERLSWENGHVPGSSGAIPILQLRGEGCVALRSRRSLLAVEVRAARALVVDAAALVGWTGSLVPRLTGPTVEFSGDGAVFLEEPR